MLKLMQPCKVGDEYTLTISMQPSDGSGRYTLSSISAVLMMQAHTMPHPFDPVLDRAIFNMTSIQI